MSGLATRPDQLVAELRRRVPDLSPEEIAVPFEVPPEAVERARAIAYRYRTEYLRAQELMRAVTAEEGLGLRYERVGTSTPEVTLRRGYGNCWTLTSMYIGLAREIGLAAYYVDASDRVSELRRERELIVQSGHIAAAVRTEGGFSLVDYDGRVSEYRTFRLISDLEALAHYYNNLGFDLIYEAQTEDLPIPWEVVRRNFEIGTEVWPGFARGHNNLGVALARVGRDDEAERAYRAAIDSDHGMAAAYQNLGNLLLGRGEIEAALRAYDEAMARDSMNPYLHHHRGLGLYRSGDLAAAAASFERAIRLKPDYVEPHDFLAIVYDQQGRHQEAEEMRRRAQALRSGRSGETGRPAADRVGGHDP